MADPYISSGTIDDLMRSVIEAIQVRGVRIRPKKGDATELPGVLLELTDPRARLSRTETRGKLFSCLGELCWYLAKSKDLKFIHYYIPKYEDSAEGGEIFGGYGPRLFTWKQTDQVSNITRLLRQRPDSRQAVIQLFDATDIVEEHKDVPCTCTLQFMIREGRLHLFAHMRSNDAFKGLPHDIFSFTMLQEILARDLSVEMGGYKHAVGSLHLYDADTNLANQFINEGWQSTKPMPAMPIGDPWPAVSLILQAESLIRQGQFVTAILEDTDPYWADLIRLLQVFKCKRDKNVEQIKSLRAAMSAKVYLPFIDKVLSGLV